MQGLEVNRRRFGSRKGSVGCGIGPRGDFAKVLEAITIAICLSRVRAVVVYLDRIAQAVAVCVLNQGIGPGGKFLQVGQAVAIGIPGGVRERRIKPMDHLPGIRQTIAVQVQGERIKRRRDNREDQPRLAGVRIVGDSSPVENLADPLKSRHPGSTHPATTRGDGSGSVLKVEGQGGGARENRTVQRIRAGGRLVAIGKTIAIAVRLQRVGSARVHLEPVRDTIAIAVRHARSSSRREFGQVGQSVAVGIG